METLHLKLSAPYFYPTTLRHSAVRYSIFCGSLFNPDHRSDPSIYQKTVPFWPSFIRATPLAWKTASLIKKETNEHRTSNVQHRTSNECSLSVLKKDLAERFHPSAFHIPTSAFVKCFTREVQGAGQIWPVDWCVLWSAAPLHLTAGGNSNNWNDFSHWLKIISHRHTPTICLRKKRCLCISVWVCG